MNRSVVGLLLLGLLAALGATRVQADGILFRYLPGAPGLSSPVVGEGVEPGPYLAPAERPARGPGGWGLAPTWTVEFEAPGTTLRSAASEPATQLFAPRLTAEVWVRPAEVAGDVVLLTNRAGDAADGIRLGIRDGAAYGAFRLHGVDYEVTAPGSAGAGEDHWIAFTVRRTGTDVVLALYVDGRRRAERTVTPSDVPNPFPIARPFFVGTEATGDPAAPVLRGSLTGHLYAATVRDYVAEPVYLESPVSFDGGPFLGIPAYYEAPLGGFSIPMDQRIDDYDLPTRYRFYLPYSNDDYIPQGLATHYEVAGADTTYLVYVAYYHRTLSGSTGNQASIVAEMDVQAHGRLRRVFRLRGTLGASHAGGLAYDRGAIFVSSAGYLERYPLPPYEGEGAEKYQDLAPDPSGSTSVLSKASFVSAHRDTLWVGDYRTNSEQAPYLFGYPLDGTGRPRDGVTPAVFALPRYIQGVELVETNAGTYFLLSRNRNSREAEVLRVPRSALDRWTPPEPDSVVTFPHGIEDLSFSADGTLWTNSESGAVYYQLTAGWESFYPFVYGAPGTALFPGGVSTASERSRPSEDPLRFDLFPNPGRVSGTVSLRTAARGGVRIDVVDLLGRRVAVLHEGALPGGRLDLVWPSLGAGAYFVVLETAGRRLVKPIMLLP